MIQNHASVELHDRFRQGGIKRETAWIVNDFHPKLESAFGHFRFVRVHRQGDGEFLAQSLQYGYQTLEFFRRGHRLCARFRGFSADVDNIRALLFHFHRARVGAIGV